MKPLPSEQLPNPIALKKCPGLAIHEWRRPDAHALQRLNRICRRAIMAFEPFLEKKNLQKQHDQPFFYDIALLRDTTAYRGMNDVRYRFKYRANKKDLWGYTSKLKRFVFMVDTIYIPEMANIFSHELFHALSMHYGVFDSHGNTTAERVRTDEMLASEFTQYLGLGK